MLVPVRLPPVEAAAAIRAAWDSARPVAVLDPNATPEQREHQDTAVAPERVVHFDTAAIVLTSGTAGDPRAVELTWRGLAVMARWVPVEPGDRWLCCLPPHHVAGLAVLARAGSNGVPVEVLDRFDVEAVARSKATLVSLVPTMVRRLVAAGVDLARFRTILVGGGPVPPDIADLPNVTTTYGLTETWGGVVHDGHPLPGVEVDLADDGEILVRTPTVMRGYRLDGPATAAAFTPDGRLRTGDIGGWTADGRLAVVDRKRDLVITGGVNVSPTAVERVLATHPAVADVGVAGLPDPEWGERVVAYVVPSAAGAAPSLDELRKFARPHLDPPQLPRQVVVVDQIPRTPGGKPLRRLLGALSVDEVHAEGG
ncbi:MAG TPA: class I adenylate-forming enzyme family protein [Acidimicrobiales bacterium]